VKIWTFHIRYFVGSSALEEREIIGADGAGEGLKDGSPYSRGGESMVSMK
jgi:hypothetical protein